MSSVELKDIRAAAERIVSYVHRTPVLTSSHLDERLGCRLYFKCENLQKAGAFKARGAHNAVFALPETQAARGVVTHSSGNHAAALALAARRRGVAAHIVMPSNAPAVKKAAVAGYGGIIIECEPTLSARERTAAATVMETGGTLVHPYDDFHIIAGQGTAALELLTQQPELDLVLAPVGGGGLLSGSAVAVRQSSARTRVIGVEPELADDTYRSFRSGTRVAIDASHTVADGLRVSLGERNFEIIRRLVDDIVLVSDAAIVNAMRTLWERMKIVVEPSAAVPLAALLDRKLEPAGQRVGIILSGGNVDLDRLPWLDAGCASGTRAFMPLDLSKLQ